MSTVIEAPNGFHRYLEDPKVTVLFLAGSIEMGTAEEWQKRAIEYLADVQHLVILNPRRRDWDSSWEQSIDNPQFRQQVEWELEGLESASGVFFYLDPTTKSPITLLEIGLCVGGPRLWIVCPHGFWRRGNIEVLCHKYNLHLYDTLDDGLSAVHEWLHPAEYA